MKITALCRQIYFKSTGYSYTHLGRLFLRMFVGLMLAQFGIRQISGGMTDISLDGCIPYLTEGLELWLIITVDIICSFCIMIGFFTRLMIFPPLALMICALAKSSTLYVGATAEMLATVYALPFMFLGIYIFLLLVGPGKISVDYFYSLYLINRDQGKEEDLELV